MNMFFRLSLIPLAVIGLCVADLRKVDAGILVDTKLALVIDVSGSVSTTEYNLQMDGYAAAFRTSAVQNLILNGPIGQIAVNTTFFSSSATTPTAFTLLDDAASINAYADYLDNVSRPGGIGSLTGISNGINAVLPGLLNTSDFESNRLVIDVSGDGTQNTGPSLAAAVANAQNNNVTINGLAIGDSALVTYFTSSVITSNGFVEQAPTFSDFNAAVDRKLRIELTPGGEVPEPGSLAIASVLGLMGLARRRRRNR